MLSTLLISAAIGAHLLAQAKLNFWYLGDARGHTWYKDGPENFLGSGAEVFRLKPKFIKESCQ